MKAGNKFPCKKSIFFKDAIYRDFPGGPGVKTALPLQGAQVQSLVGKLRSHMPCGVAQKKKKDAICIM